MTKEGTLEFNEAQFDGALADDFNAIQTMLTADTNDQSIYGSASRGLAGDAKVFLDELLRVTGVVTTSIRRGEEQLAEYQADLSALDQRMELLKERYINQFASMQQVVDQMNSTRDYLQRQFDAMNGGND
jgi:flagellar hook-associated protein 2